jgi:hypothetical protein
MGKITMCREEKGGKDNPVQRGKYWGRCPCAERRRMGKIPTPCAGRKRMGKLLLCREEKNGQDAPCAERKRVGKMPLCLEENIGEDVPYAGRKSRALLKRRERSRCREHIEQRLGLGQLRYNM